MDPEEDRERGENEVGTERSTNGDDTESAERGQRQQPESAAQGRALGGAEGATNSSRPPRRSGKAKSKIARASRRRNRRR